ncbi:hypothetical protein [Ponticoccus sp. (in: a-proteobacteria)]|uniref:hypothetical protein n=1 Tax=Ponticoccus sp. (in: a-proteobacteria) TaxID=1925025 RepID=UPI003AB2A207
MSDVADLIEAEIVARSERMTVRVRVLTERYGQILPEVSDDVEMLSATVFAHLETMGFA